MKATIPTARSPLSPVDRWKTIVFMHHAPPPIAAGASLSHVFGTTLRGPYHPANATPPHTPLNGSLCLPAVQTKRSGRRHDLTSHLPSNTEKWGRAFGEEPGGQGRSRARWVGMCFFHFAEPARERGGSERVDSSRVHGSCLGRHQAPRAREVSCGAASRLSSRRGERPWYSRCGSMKA